MNFGKDEKGFQKKEKEKEKEKGEENGIRIGIVADVHYCDIDNGMSFWGVPRLYRFSEKKFDNCLKTFSKENVDMITQLGDLADGFSSKTKSTEKNLVKFLGKFEKFKTSKGKKVPIVHVVGNHEIRELAKSDYNRIMGIKTEEKEAVYYYVDIKGYRIIVLDSYDISYYSSDKVKRGKAYEILTKKNGKKKGDGQNWDAPPKGKSSMRFVRWNGGVGHTQLKWLKKVINVKKDKSVILLSHLAVHPMTCYGTGIMWNYADVLEIIEDNSEKVLGVFNGHEHTGGSFFDKKKKILYFCVEGMIYSQREDCYAILTVGSNKLEVKGYGTVSSRSGKIK